MVNQPDQNMEGVQMPSGRLVLPALPEEEQYAQTSTAPIRSDQFISQSASPSPHGLFTQNSPRVRRDPAYIVLGISIALVVVASIVVVAFGANAFLNNNNQTPNATGTANHQSTFSTVGSTPSSQPTAQLTNTPVPQPTLTTTPTNQGALNVQIVTIPTIVNNNTKVLVHVSTTKPGVTVKLQVTYTVAPFLYTSRTAVTNNQGLATLTWSVKVLAFSGNTQPSVVAIATNNQGNKS